MKTAKDFYKFFSAIPQEMWHRGWFENWCGTKFCALGHIQKICDLNVIERQTAEDRLNRIFYDSFRLHTAAINDARRHGKSPRDNILEALQIAAELGH